MKDGVAVATGHMKIAGSEYRSIGSDEGPFLKLDRSKVFPKTMVPQNGW